MYDFRPNCNPLSSITITNIMKTRTCSSAWFDGLVVINDANVACGSGSTSRPSCSLKILELNSVLFEIDEIFF